MGRWRNTQKSLMSMQSPVILIQTGCHPQTLAIFWRSRVRGDGLLGQTDGGYSKEAQRNFRRNCGKEISARDSTMQTATTIRNSQSISCKGSPIRGPYIGISAFF